jgi:hypothetical protein
MSTRKKNVWPRARLFAVTVDGEVLLNVHAIEGLDALALVRGDRDVFVGVVLRPGEVRRLGKCIRDACSDAAASFASTRRPRSRSP